MPSLFLQEEGMEGKDLKESNQKAFRERLPSRVLQFIDDIVSHPEIQAIRALPDGSLAVLTTNYQNEQRLFQFWYLSEADGWVHVDTDWTDLTVAEFMLLRPRPVLIAGGQEVEEPQEPIPPLPPKHASVDTLPPEIAKFLNEQRKPWDADTVYAVRRLSRRDIAVYQIHPDGDVFDVNTFWLQEPEGTDPYWINQYVQSADSSYKFSIVEFLLEKPRYMLDYIEMTTMLVKRKQQEREQKGR